MFSIVTVTLNSKNNLCEALDSVRHQDYINFEHLIVDGGSSDGTVEIIRKYAADDNRVRWISEADDGIADAFNKGIRMASGNIIGILNSDDRYATGALKMVAEAVALHPECDIFHGDMLRYQDDTPLFLLKSSDVQRNIWHEMPLNHPATFVTRKAYQQVGLFDTRLKLAMDYDMILRLYRAGFCFWHIDEVLAHMRYGGISDERMMDGLKEVYWASVRQGYPEWKAAYWMMHKGGLRCCKLLLRKLGLYSLMRLHPKFKRLPDEKMPL